MDETQPPTCVALIAQSLKLKADLFGDARANRYGITVLGDVLSTKDEVAQLDPWRERLSGELVQTPTHATCEVISVDIVEADAIDKAGQMALSPRRVGGCEHLQALATLARAQVLCLGRREAVGWIEPPVLLFEDRDVDGCGVDLSHVGLLGVSVPPELLEPDGARALRLDSGGDGTPLSRR